MNSIKQDWQFDSNITPIFDQHVRKHVPLYDELHQMINEIADWYIEDSTNVYDIGTSTGKLICDLYSRIKRKNVSFIGIDTSSDMIEFAKENLSQIKNLTLFNGNVLDEDFIINNASFAASILTNQFNSISDRIKLISKIYNGMNVGGAYIIVEKVIGNNARFNEMWVEMYHESKLLRGLSEKEVMDKARSIRGILKPLTIDENVKLLKDAGFKDVDVFFKWCNFAGMIAVK